MNAHYTAKRIFVIAGEASGDLLGADLLSQIKAEYPDSIIAGIGGDQMLSSGLPQSLFPLSDLSVMGLVEVLKHLPRLITRIAQTKQAIRAFQPDLLLTIDAPDFCLRIARWVKATMPQVKIIHTVAPTVWAWRPGRAKKIAQFLDGLLCLFPFEPKYFTIHGLKAKFMGHPLAQIVTPLTDEKKKNFFAQYQLDDSRPILCLLPGSRNREIESLLPVFIQSAKTLLQSDPLLQIILPALPRLADIIRATCRESHLPVTIITDRADKYTAMQVSGVALHASGTVALELAFCDTPMVTAYRANRITEWIGRRILTIRYLNLVNLLRDETIVPEMIQAECTAEKIVPVLDAILNNKVSAALQRQNFAIIRKKLQPDEPAVKFISEILK